MTTKELAKLLGINQSTVSRAFNDDPSISEETKTRVKEMAVKYNYIPRSSKKSYSELKTKTIGFILPNEFLNSGMRRYFLELIAKGSEICEQHSYDLIFVPMTNRFNGENSIKRLITEKKVDAFAIASNTVTPDIFDYIAHERIPAAFMGRSLNASFPEYVSQICFDNEYGGYIATEHLIMQGCQKIMFITMSGNNEVIDCQERLKGYKRALKDHNIAYNRSLIINTDSSFNSAFRAIINDNVAGHFCDGIIAVNSDLALGAISALNYLQRKVPQDACVVGYDDDDICTMISPTLTSIHTPVKEMCDITFNYLIEQIKHNDYDSEPKRMMIRPQLIIRESSLV